MPLQLLLDEKMNSVDSLKQVINELEMSQTYFSDILNAQLVIFSLIVAVVVALYFLFNYRISRNHIEREVKKATDEFKKAILEEHETQNKQIMEKLTENYAKHENSIAILRGEVYRTLGLFWTSEKSHASAFIWWIRAAHAYAVGRDEDMTRIALGSAKESVEKVSDAYQLVADIIGEFQRLIAEIDEKIYKIEKDLLDKALKDALNRKPQK